MAPNRAWCQIVAVQRNPRLTDALTVLTDAMEVTISAEQGAGCR
jgi:hypothetical protein